MSDTALLPGMVGGFGLLLLALSLVMMLISFNGAPIWSWRDYFIGIGVMGFTAVALVALIGFLVWVLS